MTQKKIVVFLYMYLLPNQIINFIQFSRAIFHITIITTSWTLLYTR